MNFREAVIEDISQMQTVRNSVKENVLSDPGLVSYADYHKYIIHRGKGWVAEEDGTIIGFSVADLVDMNIWALFVLPRFEKKGVGKKLHQLMLDWYFSQVKEPVWLSTRAPLQGGGFLQEGRMERGWSLWQGGNKIRNELRRLVWISTNHCYH